MSRASSHDVRIGRGVPYRDQRPVRSDREADATYTLDELQRQFACDRALARLFTAPDADGWVLKGAGALLARLEQAGAKTLAVVHIDVVVGTSMSGKPDEVAPLTPLHIDGLVRPSYRAFPLVDHVADKFCAIIRTHAAGGAAAGSSRIKGLVDVALIATNQQISAPALRVAILAGTTHRSLSVPDHFAVPDDAVWRRGYPRSAADAPGPMPTFDEAVSLASALPNPVLDGAASGIWDPETASWAPRAG